MKLVASAIVRNEQGRYLEPWLTHLLTFCDEVRLLDDGSLDETHAAAEGIGPEVQVSENTGPSFFENESAARNNLLRWTIEGKPTYVLSIDADEFVGDTEAVRKAILSDAPVYSLTMREVWKVMDGDMPSVGLRVDGLWGDRRCPILWRAPGRIQGRWQIPNRKLACGREPQAVRGHRGVDTGSGVYHFGWTRVGEREVRAERYFEHDGGRYHANAHLQSLLDPDEKVTFDWKAWPTSIPDKVMELAAR